VGGRNTNATPAQSPARYQPFLRHSKFISLLLILAFLSCQTKKTLSTLTYNKFYTEYLDKILLVDTTESYELKDLGIDTVVGGYYEFYKNGNLKSYNFFYDEKKDTSLAFFKKYGNSKVSYSAYAEFYDNYGKLDSVKDNPFVYSWIKIKDSCIVNFRLFFFSLDKEYDKIKIQTSNNNKYDLQLLSDTIFTNMKYVNFDVDAKGLDSIYAFVSTKYKNLNLGTYVNLKDTVPVEICRKQRHQ
jgi:hypothetical protein